MRPAAREITELGLVRLKQGGRLNVRQRDLLRRALARAGEALGWAGTAANSEDPVAEILKELEHLIAEDARHLKVELAATVAAKTSEISDLEDVAASARTMSEADDVDYPTEISYSHTARDVSLGLITNTETMTVSDDQEAEDLAGTIEKSLSRWDRLRGQMLQEVEEEQVRLARLTRDLSDYVASMEDLVRDVIVTLA